jgi:hypothetical protein
MTIAVIRWHHEPNGSRLATAGTDRASRSLYGWAAQFQVRQTVADPSV